MLQRVADTVPVSHVAVWAVPGLFPPPPVSRFRVAWRSGPPAADREGGRRLGAGGACRPAPYRGAELRPGRALVCSGRVG